MIPNNFALTTLSQNPEYFEEVISLIEEGFHYQEGQHFEKDFAPLVNPLNFENCYLYIDQESNTVAAHLALSLRTMIKGDAEINVALIGGIVTNKKYRGRNLFKSLMDNVLLQHKEKVGLFILWSDLENIYEKFSFFRTGGLIETGKRNFSDSERPSGFGKTKFSVLNDRDFSSIVELYRSFNQKYFFTIKRDDKDWSVIREMDTIDLFIKRNSDGTIAKYFCVNKGRDLTNIIHEVSCQKSSDYLPFLNTLSSFKLWLPESEAKNVSSSDLFYTAFIRIGSIDRLNSFLKVVTKNELKIVSVNVEFLKFDYQGKSFEVSAKDFLQYLFGPKPLQEFESFKLSMYITGADSV